MDKRTALIGVALVVVAVVLLIVLSSGESDNDEPIVDTTTSTQATGDGKGGGEKPGEEPAPPPQPKVPTIVVDAEGMPVGGVAELTFEQGDTVRFKVKSAVADHVHVHGYDLMKDVGPGSTVSFDFPAELEGIYEAELEDRAEPIAELRVEP
ncbi:MAG TPA: hypothetical protein VGV69_02860 [Solirubrobacterales bacterium]|nr:hypothetical protein [Solirubrobacterales bacterium]